jgi:hypothetical protein
MGSSIAITYQSRRSAMRRQVLLSKQTPGEASLSFPDPEMMLECTLTPNDEGSGKHFY